MAEIDRSGFEVNAVSDDGWTSIIGTPSIYNVLFRSGANSLRLNPAVAASTCVKLAFTGNSIVVLQAAIYFTSVPSGNAWLLRIENVGETGPAVSVTYDQSNNWLQVDANDGVTNVTSFGPTALATGTWYEVELLADATANPWNVKWRVNGFDYTTLTPAFAAMTWGVLYMGLYQAVTADMLIDDYVLFSGSTGNYPTGDIRTTTKTTLLAAPMKVVS